MYLVCVHPSRIRQEFLYNFSISYLCVQGYKETKTAPPGLTYELDENYFLTDPDTFVYNHRPLQDEWQLLARPVTFSEFKVCSAQLLFFVLFLEF